MTNFKFCPHCGNSLEPQFKWVEHPFDGIFNDDPYLPGKVITKDNFCLLDQYYKDHPEDIGKPLMLSCSCPKHSVR